MTHPYDMISPEDALALVLDQVSPLEVETVPLIDSVGRVAAQNLCSDVDITPFDHAAMDGFAVHADDLTSASEQSPAVLSVIAEAPAGSVYDGPVGPGECVRIMTGAPLPAACDSVVKYEIVDYLDGDGRKGSQVAFSAPTDIRSNVRSKAEEIAKGEIAVHAGDQINSAGIGFLASCGILQVPVYRRPRVAIIATGSELVEPDTVPQGGQIRNSNSYAMAACVVNAGGVPDILAICPDSFDALQDTLLAAVTSHDLVLTTGGACEGDYDFIKPVVEANGTLLMTRVNMRPGKAQTFGLINHTPVFGLPGNPAAAYCGFELLVRQMLRKMQGFVTYSRVSVTAKLDGNRKKRDPRRIYLRATLERREDGLHAIPARNQSSGLFGTIQRGNCLAIMPEGTNPMKDGDAIECILLDVEEGLIL